MAASPDEDATIAHFIQSASPSPTHTSRRYLDISTGTSCLAALSSMTGEEQVEVNGRWSSNQPRELLPCPPRMARSSSAGTNASCRHDSRSCCIILSRSSSLNVSIIGWLGRGNFQPRHRVISGTQQLQPVLHGGPRSRTGRHMSIKIEGSAQVPELPPFFYQ